VLNVPFNVKVCLVCLQGARHLILFLEVVSLYESLMVGGIRSMSITEVYGEFRCGKTQLCHTMCVTAQLPREMGGAEGKVVFLMTELMVGCIH
jgi:hypothetical protein